MPDINTLVEECRLCSIKFTPKNKNFKYCKECRSLGLTATQMLYRSDWPKAQCRLKKYYCKKNNIPFDLTPSDIFVPTHCPALGIELIFNNTSSNKDNSPSVDRIAPSLGYVKGNVRVISMKANRIKNDASLEELEKVYQWLKQLTA